MNGKYKKEGLIPYGLIIIVQICNIVLFFINIGFGNNYVIILTILISLCGLIVSAKYREMTYLIFNLIYIIVTIIIYFNKILFILIYYKNYKNNYY